MTINKMLPYAALAAGAYYFFMKPSGATNVYTDGWGYTYEGVGDQQLQLLIEQDTMWGV